MRKIRYIIFLRDVLILAFTCFGGPQAHLSMFLEHLVRKHRYITEEELLELQALCQVLPGPTSTQTITAIGYRLGGPNLAYLTLIVWITPAVFIMTAVGIGVSYLAPSGLASIARFIKPMAVAFIAFAVFRLGSKVIRTKTSLILMFLAIPFAYFYQTPYVAPILILLGGLTTALKFQQHEKRQKAPIKIQWANFILWVAVLVVSGVLGAVTDILPVSLFENFYRNGSVSFGGGHILKPLLYNEFVVFKNYLTEGEFLSGVAISEVVPGPVFAIASYVGVLTMRTQGIWGELLGSAVATTGIFLPGTFLIFFVIRFWEQLKQYRGIRASLEGINAASTGLTAAAAFSLFEPMATDYVSVITVIVTFILLQFTKIPPYFLILGGLLLGFLIKI
jgi:chromate transporter